jgi:hypothetical protein
MTSLVTLPIRLPLEITWRAAKFGVGVLRTVTGLIEGDAADERAPWPADGDGTRPAPAAEPIITEPEAIFEPEPTPVPAHVDREAELAYEAGPAQDAGAEVHVEAPWDGYDRMRAADIVARLKGADAATRAVVRLYEQQGKARTSVLAAKG